MDVCGEAATKFQVQVAVFDVVSVVCAADGRDLRHIGQIYDSSEDREVVDREVPENVRVFLNESEIDAR